MMQGFEVFDFKAKPPVVSITENGLVFNWSVCTLLDFPLYVRVLINRSDKMIAIQKASESDSMKKTFWTASRERTKHSCVNRYVRFNDIALNREIAEMMNWYLPDTGPMRVRGTYCQEEQAVIFDLKKARGTGNAGKAP